MGLLWALFFWGCGFLYIKDGGVMLPAAISFLCLSCVILADGMVLSVCSEGVFWRCGNFFREMAQKNMELCLVIPNFVIFVHR